jgi:hypothetical protein
MVVVQLATIPHLEKFAAGIAVKNSLGLLLVGSAPIFKPIASLLQHFLR